MILKSLLVMIPAGVLDSQSPQEWPRFFVHGDHQDLPHTIPPLISIIWSPRIHG